MLSMTQGIETQAERIRARMAELGVTQMALAEAVGISQGAVGHILKGRTLQSKYLPNIARALHVNLSWLTMDTDKMIDLLRMSERSISYEPEPAQLGPSDASIADNSVLLPELEIGYSMGGGSVFSDYQEVARIPFPRDWVRALAKGRFDELFVARGEGDSMTPTILDNDSVLIDTAQKRITQQDRIWCLSYGDLGMIKRVRVQPDGGILVMSDNPAVADFTAYDGEVHVVGRVVWIGRKV